MFKELLLISLYLLSILLVFFPLKRTIIFLYATNRPIVFAIFPFIYIWDQVMKFPLTYSNGNSICFRDLVRYTQNSLQRPHHSCLGLFSFFTSRMIFFCICMNLFLLELMHHTLMFNLSILCLRFSRSVLGVFNTCI